MAEKTHDSTNSLAQQFCSHSYPGNSSSFPPRYGFSVYNCFLSLGSTYLSNNSLLAEKTHDSTNYLAQQFCSRSYPGNSYFLQPRHCFIVYNCFLSFGSTYLSNNFLLAKKTHDSTNQSLLSSSEHVLIQVILFLFSPDFVSLFIIAFYFSDRPTYLTTLCWPRRLTIRLTPLLSSSAHVLIQVILIFFSSDIVSLFIIAFYFSDRPTYLTTLCWPRRLTIRLTPLLSSSAHVLIQIILILFSPDIVSLFIIAFYL